MNPLAEGEAVFSVADAWVDTSEHISDDRLRRSIRRANRDAGGLRVYARSQFD